MFKKRTLNKDSAPIAVSRATNNDGSNTQKKSFVTGIDLRKDIQQMEQIITDKQHHRDYPQKQQDNDQEKDAQKQPNSLFKTKRINKFTSHILKNLPTKTLEKQSHQPSILNQKYPQPINQSVKTEQPEQSHSQNPSNQLFRPNLSNYGLLDKNHFSGPNKNTELIQTGKGKNHQQALMDYYIKKRMEQMTKPPNLTPSQSLGAGNPNRTQRQPQAWQEVLQIQKQYLTQQQKIKDYSIQQIQKKLEKLAQQTIKTQIEKRNSYFKDLLENQYERMEYASKKQLKYMRQDKERIERELNSKYRDSGRKNFIDNIKNQVF